MGHPGNINRLKDEARARATSWNSKRRRENAGDFIGWLYLNHNRAYENNMYNVNLYIYACVLNSFMILLWLWNFCCFIGATEYL